MYIPIVFLVVCVEVYRVVAKGGLVIRATRDEGGADSADEAHAAEEVGSFARNFTNIACFRNSSHCCLSDFCNFFQHVYTHCRMLVP